MYKAFTAVMTNRYCIFVNYYYYSLKIMVGGNIFSWDIMNFWDIINYFPVSHQIARKQSLFCRALLLVIAEHYLSLMNRCAGNRQLTDMISATTTYQKLEGKILDTWSLWPETLTVIRYNEFGERRIFTLFLWILDRVKENQAWDKKIGASFLVLIFCC